MLSYLFPGAELARRKSVSEELLNQCQLFDFPDLRTNVGLESMNTALETHFLVKASQNFQMLVEKCGRTLEGQQSSHPPLLFVREVEVFSEDESRRQQAEF